MHGQRRTLRPPRQANRRAAAEEGDTAVAHHAQATRVRALERGVGVRVRLAHVVGAVELTGHGDHHAGAGQRRIGGGGDRVAKVLGAVIRLLRRRPHGADHDDRLGGQGQQVPGEGRLLDDVRALHHHRTVDVGPPELIAEDAADLEHLVEREVGCGHEAPVDRLDLSDLGQAGNGGEELVATHGRDVAGGCRIVPHRDGAAGEHDGDARHGPSMPGSDDLRRSPERRGRRAARSGRRARPA